MTASEGRQNVIRGTLIMRWRTGRKLGRTIYVQLGPEPSDDDVLIGLMDFAEVAQAVVNDHNKNLENS